MPHSFIDTHAHLYVSDFKEDIVNVIEQARNAGIIAALLPNIDADSIEDLLALCKQYPHFCYPMMGLHPTSVKENVEQELAVINKYLQSNKFIAIGEVGIDLYWDKTFQAQQEQAFIQQIQWADTYNLPLVIHTRNSMPETLALLQRHATKNTRGVFHCFSGNLAEAQTVVEMGFCLGIGGVVTFKKSELPEIVLAIELEKLLLETDSPYLAPMPYRGKQNQPAYIPLIAEKIAEIKNISIEKVAEVTTHTAQTLFNLPD